MAYNPRKRPLTWAPGFSLRQNKKRPAPVGLTKAGRGALEGTRTPNLLIRSQMLYPLSYERSNRCNCSTGKREDAKP